MKKATHQSADLKEETETPPPLEDQTIVTAGTVEKYRNRRLRINAAVTPCSTSTKVMGSDQTLSVPFKGL